MYRKLTTVSNCSQFIDISPIDLFIYLPSLVYSIKALKRDTNIGLLTRSEHIRFKYS